MVQNLLEKLLLKDEKNLLIQGLPSSIEKQFSKLSFAKNLTPLLKSRKIDFALIFAVNEKQLNDIVKEVIPAMHPDGKLWIAYPKTASKIVTDLNRDGSWQYLFDCGFSGVRSIALDHVWTAMWFKIQTAAEKKKRPDSPDADGSINYQDRTITIPDELSRVFHDNSSAFQFFETLSFTNKKEYVLWITGAKKEETKEKRLAAIIEKLNNGKKNPSEK